MYQVLMIDDDIELCKLLKEYLQGEGFNVIDAQDGKSGIEALKKSNYDIVILDVMLPTMNGFDTLHQIRKFSNIPILMLTARGDDIDKIVGLEMGADDYLPKPCNPRELVVRLKTILRRVKQESLPEKENLLTVGDMSINRSKREILLKNNRVDLTNTEYNLLLYLLDSAGEAVSKERLYEKILMRKMEPYDRTLDVHISKLRQKLGKNRIKTIHGFGYLYEK